MPPYQPIKPPSFAAPTVDPAMRARMRPGSQVQEADLMRRGGSLGTKYQPLKTTQIGSTRAKLQRYGGYEVRDDGSIAEKKEGQPGQAYREAYQEATAAANARGMLESSFAAKTIGQAWGRLSAEAQDIVTQHAVSFNQILMSEGAEFDEINTGLMQLYGDEAQYQLDNPPPPPADPVQGAVDSAAKAPGDQSPVLWKGANYPNLAELQKRYPGQQLGVRKTGDGKYVVVVGSGNAQRPGTTAPRPSQVVNGGRPTGQVGRGSGNVRWF